MIYNRIYNNYRGKGVGAQIKIIREELNESQAEMAKFRFHKPVYWLSRVELGKITPTLEDLKCLEAVGYQAIEIDNAIKLVKF